MKALLVDNEKFFMDCLAALLKQIDPRLEITGASSESEMRRCLASSQFDMIFLDINLGDEDDGRGLEILKELKDNDESPLMTPIIMVSNRQDKETMSISYNNGAFGFLPKMTGSSEMASTVIERILKNEPYFPPQSHAIAQRPKRRVIKENDSGLTPKVFETLYYLVRGLSNKSIAKAMDNISPNVVAERVTVILKNFKVLNRMELMAKLYQEHILIDVPNSLSRRV